MPQPTTASPVRHPAGGRRRGRVALVLLGVAWTVVVPALAGRAFLRTMTFFGEQPTAADRVLQHHDLTVALGVAGALVVAGLVLSVQARSTAGGGVFGLLLAPTLLVGLLWLGTGGVPTSHVPAAPGTPSGACQEYSGGGTRCPGG